MSEQQKGLPEYFKIIIGIFGGIVVAIFGAQLGFSHLIVDWIAPFGKIFINCLKMIAVPLVLLSIISGITSLTDASLLGRLTSKTIGLYLITTLIAIGIGIGVTSLVGPGNMISEEQKIANRLDYELWVTETPGVEITDGKDYLNNPKYVEFIASAKETHAIQSAKDAQTFGDKLIDARSQNTQGPLQPLVDIFPENIFESMANNKLLLQVIAFALFFGVSIMLLNHDKTKPVTDFIHSANEIFLKMTAIIMKAAPFFVFALLAGEISKIAADHPERVGELFISLGYYAVCVILGLAIMVLVVYPAIFLISVKGISYKQFFKAIRQAQIVAFSTSSSAATLPVTLDCVENKLGVSKKTSSFVLPIGATVNMDGTSLYQAVAVIFLAQFHVIDLSGTQLAILVVTTMMASIGSAAVPSAGIIMLLIVLETLGLNPFWISIILPIDRLLDMCRTVVNVTGDAVVASAIAVSEGEDLKNN